MPRHRVIVFREVLMHIAKVIIGIVVALLVVGGATVFGVTQYQKKKGSRGICTTGGRVF